MLTPLRAYPVLLGLLVFVVIAAGILTVLAVLMTRAGLSLKPIVFIAVFLAIVAAPQLAYHTLRARGIAPDLTWTPSKEAPSFREKSAAVAFTDGKFDEPEIVFGAGYDRDLLSDVRRLFEPIVAEAAQMAVYPALETAIAAVFADSATAYRARNTYAGMMGYPNLESSPDGKADLVRAGGDRVRLFVAGRVLFVWTGADTAALDRRMKASSGSWFSSPKGEPQASDPRRAKAWKVVAVAGLFFVLLASFWFFKGSAWASSIAPTSKGTLAASASDLRSRLMAIESLKQPISVTAGVTTNEVVVTWRFDAAWLTFARANGIRRVHKLVLSFDERARTVRVREYVAALDASISPQSASFAWRGSSGVTFFHAEHQRVFGLQLDPATGRMKPQASFAYTFNLQEMKSPLITAVTNAGWTWQPLVWDGPVWLRWATE